MFKNRRNIYIFVAAAVVVIVAIVLVIASVRSQGTTAAAYQTTTVQLGTLTSSVQGSGSVSSALTSSLTWQTSGQVDKVNVQIGNQVKAGDILASVLPPSSTQSTLETALVNAQAALAELTSPEAIANAKLDITTAQTNLINAQSALNNTQYWQNAALIQDYYSKFVIAKANLAKAQKAYDNAHVGQYINNTGEAGLYQALYNAQQAYNTAQYYYSLYSQKPTQRQLDQAQANLDLANATLTNAQNYLTALTGGDVPADATGASLLKFEQAKLAVQAAQDNLDAANLTAPFNGTITQSSAVPGQIVSASSAAFRIDDLTDLVVAIPVVQIDVNSVKAGQPATITFDAIPNKTYNGKVIKVDLAGTSSSSTVNFNVSVQLSDADAQVKPGMTANVTITTNQVDNALLIPSTSIFTDTNGQNYVYLVQNGTTTAVAVTVGATSDTSSQITGDTLKEGDIIVLSFASTTSSSSSSRGFGLGGFGGGGEGGGTRVITTP